MVGCRGGGVVPAAPELGRAGVPVCGAAVLVRGSGAGRCGAALPSRITYGVPGRRRC